MSTDEGKILAGPAPVAAFIAALVWATGALCVIWAIGAWKCMTLFIPVDFPLFKGAAYSEGLVYTLLFLPVPLAALHFLLHEHQRRTSDGERFPGRLGSLAVPVELRWLRTALFIVLAVFPTFTYGYVVGRMFDHLSIEWNDELGGKQQQPRPHAKAGWKLLSDWGGKRPDGRRAGPLGSGWVWHAWQDDRPAFGTRTPDGTTKTTRSIRTTAWPGLQPVIFLSCGIAGAASLVWLIFRPLRTPSFDHPGL